MDIILLLMGLFGSCNLNFSSSFVSFLCYMGLFCFQIFITGFHFFNFEKWFSDGLFLPLFYLFWRTCSVRKIICMFYFYILEYWAQTETEIKQKMLKLLGVYLFPILIVISFCMGFLLLGLSGSRNSVSLSLEFWNWVLNFPGYQLYKKFWYL